MDYQKQLEDVFAEKLALDQLYVESLKSALLCKKQIILDQQKIANLTNEINLLKEEIVKLKTDKESESNKEERAIEELINEK